jgi:hypothetical protein
MATYCAAPRRTLKHGDLVKFIVDGQEVQYRVCTEHLENPYGPNCKIFDMLKLGRGAIAQEAYGYYTDDSSGWPGSHNRDYAALTRLVRLLFDKIKKHNARPTTKEYCRRRKLPARFAEVVEFFRKNNFGCQNGAAQSLMEAYFGCSVKITSILPETRSAR